MMGRLPIGSFVMNLANKCLSLSSGLSSTLKASLCIPGVLLPQILKCWDL